MHLIIRKWILVHPNEKYAWEIRETDRGGGGGSIQTVSHSSISGNQDVTKLETAQSLCEHHGFVTLDLRCCFQSKFRKTGFA